MSGVSACPNCQDTVFHYLDADNTLKQCNQCGHLYGYGLVGSIPGIVSPDAPTVVNERGGKQSYIPTRFDLIDAKAMFAMAKVLHEGAEKYGEDNWREIDVNDHLNHALMHIFAYLAGDRTDDHLSHLLCRATFATGVSLQEPSFDSISVEVK